MWTWYDLRQLLIRISLLKNMKFRIHLLHTALSLSSTKFGSILMLNWLSIERQSVPRIIFTVLWRQQVPVTYQVPSTVGGCVALCGNTGWIAANLKLNCLHQWTVFVKWLKGWSTSAWTAPAVRSPRAEWKIQSTSWKSWVSTRIADGARRPPATCSHWAASFTFFCPKRRIRFLSLLVQLRRHLFIFTVDKCSTRFLVETQGFLLIFNRGRCSVARFFKNQKRWNRMPTFGQTVDLSRDKIFSKTFWIVE